MKKYVVRWTNWRTKTTRAASLKMKFESIENNWWIRSNTVGSDTMPVRHRADFKGALSYLATPQESRGSSFLPKMVAKLFLILVEIGKILGGHSSSEHHRDYGPGTDRLGKPDGRLIGPIVRGYDSQN